MQESKEIGPHSISKEELDALYKNKTKWYSENTENDVLSDKKKEA